jgi:hypothetical protein
MGLAARRRRWREDLARRGRRARGKGAGPRTAGPQRETGMLKWGRWAAGPALRGANVKGKDAIGSGAGDCAPAPSHTTVRAVFRTRRLNAASIFMGKQGLMASRTHSAATPRCLAPSVGLDWLRCATLPWNCAPLLRGVRSVPIVAACAAARASRASVAKSSSECGVVSSLPFQGRSGVPRPVGSTPTSLGCKRARCPAVRHWFDSGSFAILPGLSFRISPRSEGRLRFSLVG